MHNVLSLVNAEGNQKKIGKLSSDIFCQECNTAIFVEGSFKYICKTHMDKNVSEKKKLLDKFGKLKRDKFCELLGVKECFVIATCCIENGIYSEKFKSSSFFDLKLLENPKKSIRNFPFNFYQKLDFQDAILSPINFPILTAFKSYKYPIQKFDIEAAFLSVFQNEQFVLPSSNDAIRLVGAEAQKYFCGTDMKKCGMCNSSTICEKFDIKRSKEERKVDEQEKNCQPRNCGYLCLNALSYES